jgi:hypothetical protein
LGPPFVASATEQNCADLAMSLSGRTFPIVLWAERVRSARVDQTSVFSAISRASSTSTPRKTHRAFDLGMAEQSWTAPPVAGTAIDQRRLGSALARSIGIIRDSATAHRMRGELAWINRPERLRCQPPPATLGFVCRPSDAVSKLDWAGDGAQRLEAFAGAKDRHVAVVQHAPQD